MMTTPIPNHGLLVLDKPRGPSSHQVTAWAGEILGKRVGHAGTLDPGVSGVLVVMIGNAVRLAPVLLSEEKEYIAVIRFHKNVGETAVRSVAEEFIGRIYQRPPLKSAVARNLRIRTIHALDVLEVGERLAVLRITCDAGTYIRSLCHHMGLSLGCGAHMEELRRTRSGVFSEDSAHTLAELKDAAALARQGKFEALTTMIMPPGMVAGGLPTLVIRDTAVDALCHGAALAGVGVIRQDPFQRGDVVAMLTSEGELVCIGEAIVSSSMVTPGMHGLVAAPRSVFLPPGTYPRGWKKGHKA
ncbi:MAG: putative tRNA pseudouridine synthase B [Methanoregulaceae archaeon PtaB.Bin108]|nr:MAG: putative tRNA pseudouridine synthase B [Methanoregulaceae archaeon PtaB.Bin108]